MIIDTQDIKTPLIVVAILILAASIAYAGYNYGHTTTIIQTPTVVTTTPTPTPSTSYLTNVVTVSGMTTSAGFPEVDIREDNRIFDVTYPDYDMLSVGDRVQFHVVSTYNPYGSVVYKTDYVVIISHSWDNYYRYYRYNNKYYREDNRITIEVDRDEATKHNWIDGKPSRW